MRDAVEIRDGNYYVADTRVCLDIIVYDFNQGASIEEIAYNFTVLTLEDVKGAIKFYQEHRVEVDKWIADTEPELEKLTQEINQKFRLESPSLAQRIDSAGARIR